MPLKQCERCFCMKNIRGKKVICVRCVKELDEVEKKGCSLIVAKTRGGEIKCGERMFGKKRYCAYCSQTNGKSKKNKNEQ